MKNNVKRSALCLLLVSMLVFSLIFNATAQDISNIVISESIIDERVIEMIPLIYNYDFHDSDVIAIGDRLSVYYVDGSGIIVESDYESYPLIANSEIIGIVNVFRNTNGTVSQVGLGIDYAPELQSFIDEHGNTAFSVFHTSQGVYAKLLTHENVFSLKEYTEDSGAPIVLNASKVEYAPISINTPLVMPAAVSVNSSRATTETLFKTLDVTNVSSTRTDCCQDGICWAASLAIMANYHVGTSYTALQVHDLCGCLPDLYHPAEKRYIRQLGMYAGGPHYSTGINPFCFSNLYDCIEDDMLLLLDLQRDGGGHNVVAYGYYTATASSLRYFYYMDPVSGSHILSFPESIGNPISVPLNGYTYEICCYITAY